MTPPNAQGYRNIQMTNNMKVQDLHTAPEIL